ncbi:MAG: MucB/RseB C-terminal domain-containing protein [Casimicrobiaceae bacterium]
MGVFPVRAGRRRSPIVALAPAALLALIAVTPARAADATQWLTRVAQAARQYNYIGTIVYQRGNRVETSRIIHLNQDGKEFEKLVSLDGPAREVVRGQGEVRFFYPDAKLVRVEPRTFRNVFPSLSPEQQKSLKEYYNFKVVPGERVGGIAADSVVFEPKDGLRYGHRFWSDAATGLLLKARMVNERGDVIEQFAFTDIQVNAKVDKAMVEPSWPVVPSDWTVKETSAGDVAPHATGWVVTRVPPGFTKIMEGYRKLRGRQEPVVHLVFSDGLVAVSVFIEPFPAAAVPLGMQSARGGLNIYSLKLEDSVVTIMGEAPGATIRQIGNSLARR